MAVGKTASGWGCPQMAKPQPQATEPMLLSWHRVENRLIVSISAALAAGASDERAPGSRDVHPHFYAAYVRDPDGHKLVVVCHRADGYRCTPA